MRSWLHVPTRRYDSQLDALLDSNEWKRRRDAFRKRFKVLDESGKRALV